MSNYVKTVNEYWSFDWATYTPVGKTGIAEYDQLASYYKHFLPTVIPFAAVLGYWFLSDPICGIIRSLLNSAEVKGKDGKPVKNGFDRALSLLTIVHSAALTVYSGWTCYNTYNIMTSVWNTYRQGGLGAWDTFMTMSCDGNGKLWTDANLGYWVTHFYISKFWEFLDTWIILLKGKTPILLQTYHHAGVVLLMWSFVVTHNTACGATVTLLNSGIHTIMYTYFTLTALEFKFLYKFKPFITSSQLIQFFFGIALTIPTYFVKGCNTPARTVSTIGIHVYTVVLIGLFLDFANKEYVLKAKAKAAKKE